MIFVLVAVLMFKTGSLVMMETCQNATSQIALLQRKKRVLQMERVSN